MGIFVLNGLCNKFSFYIVNSHNTNKYYIIKPIRIYDLHIAELRENIFVIWECGLNFVRILELMEYIFREKEPICMDQNSTTSTQIIFLFQKEYPLT